MAKPRFNRGSDHAFNMAAYLAVINDQGGNADTMSRLKRNLATALREEITEKQRVYLTLYYVDRMNMREIGERMGVDKSTVSRGIKLAEARLRRCLRYGAAELLACEERE